MKTRKEFEEAEIRATFVASAAEQIISGKLPDNWDEGDQLALDAALEQAGRDFLDQAELKY